MLTFTASTALPENVNKVVTQIAGKVDVADIATIISVMAAQPSE